jgi:hypothetical protein
MGIKDLTMKFNIIGLNERHGDHRFSNNTILKELNVHSEADDNIDFIWWVEKIFTKPENKDIANKLGDKDWFGVMHVPLLTPNWAQYSQNNLANLYFSEAWKKALKKCKGIIVFSEHMRLQLKALYPSLNVFSLKHPIGISELTFDINLFIKDPKILLVGAWLRDYDNFEKLKIKFEKRVLLNNYAEGYLRDVYSKYSVNILSKIRKLNCISFLENDDYDKLLSSSLVYLSVHETSANNAVCECISYEVPFVANRHPAIEEYVGVDYPLLFDDISNISSISIEDILAAHDYLRQNKHLKERLSLDVFIIEFSKVYKKLFN